MGRLILIIIMISILMSSCVSYDSAGALDSNAWIGTFENPYDGIVSYNHYSWNGTAWESLSNIEGPPGAKGDKGDTGSMGATGAAGVVGPNSVNSSTTSTNITGLVKGDGSYIQVGVGGVDYSAGFIKVKEYTRDASLTSGNISYDGVGFKPTNILFVMRSPNGIYSIGWSDSNKNSACHHMGGWNTQCIEYYQASPYAYRFGTLASYNSDGFNIIWSGTGVLVDTMYITAFCMK